MEKDRRLSSTRARASFIIAVIVISDVMSTSESSNQTGSHSKMQSNLITSTSSSLQPLNSQAHTPPPPPPLPLAPTSSASLPSSPASFNEDKHVEKFQKKGKQILFEFDQIVRGTDTHSAALCSALLCPPPVDGWAEDIRFERANNTRARVYLYPMRRVASAKPCCYSSPPWEWSMIYRNAMCARTSPSDKKNYDRQAAAGHRRLIRLGHGTVV